MKSVLVDTSIWRRYFAGDPAVRGLGGLLDEDGVVLIHTCVLGELVLGGFSAEQEALLGRLPRTAVVSDDEVLLLVRRRRLARRGIGWVDAHLLAGALVSSARLWSADKRLVSLSEELKVAFSPLSA